MEYMQTKLAAYDGPDPPMICGWAARVTVAGATAGTAPRYCPSTATRTASTSWAGASATTATARPDVRPALIVVSSRSRIVRFYVEREKRPRGYRARAIGVYLDLGLRVVDWYASAAMITAKMPRFCLCAASSKRPSCWIRIALTRKKLQVTAAT